MAGATPHSQRGEATAAASTSGAPFSQLHGAAATLFASPTTSLLFASPLHTISSPAVGTSNGGFTAPATTPSITLVAGGTGSTTADYTMACNAGYYRSQSNAGYTCTYAQYCNACSGGCCNRSWWGGCKQACPNVPCNCQPMTTSAGSVRGYCATCSIPSATNAINPTWSSGTATYVS